MDFKNILNIEFDKNRIFGLDVLRGLAILFVVIGHGYVYLPVEFFPILKLFFFDGVSIFFVLSGYLVGGGLIKIFEKETPSINTLLKFWNRRWLRTVPNYYLILTSLIILDYVFRDQMNHPGESGIKVAKYYYLFIQNFNSPHPNFFNEAWSLSVEEWFYIITPFLLFSCVAIFHINTKNSIVIISFLVILFSSFLRYYRFLNYSDSVYEWDIVFRKQVLTRLDSLMFGLIGAYFSYYQKNYWTKYKNYLLIIGISIIFIQQYSSYFIQLTNYPIYLCVFSFHITSIGVLFMLPYLSEYKKQNGRLYFTFTYISLISYSMYLLHVTPAQLYAINFIDKYITHSPFALFLSYLIFSFIGSILLYKYFEYRFIRLREKSK